MKTRSFKEISTLWFVKGIKFNQDFIQLYLNNLQLFKKLNNNTPLETLYVFNFYIFSNYNSNCISILVSDLKMVLCVPTSSFLNKHLLNHS